MDGNIFKDTMAEMTWEEIGKLAKQDAVVLFPVGVIEEHGPQLPLGTDIYLAYAQAHDVWEELTQMGCPSVIAPPFYWGGIRALPRLFPGSFPCRKETVTEIVKEILGGLDRAGFSRAVFFNDHGDGEHIAALLEGIRQANGLLSLKAYWPEYRDDMAQDGFSGEEDYLLPLTPVGFEEMFTCDAEIVDEFDIHAGAFETAAMRECFPQMVRESLLEGLKPTMLSGGQRSKFGCGSAEDRALIPQGYCGDPCNSRHIRTRMKETDGLMARDIAAFFRIKR